VYVWLQVKMKWKEQVWLGEGRFVDVERRAIGGMDFPKFIVNRHVASRVEM
jgi:hypothetical protein